MDSLMGRKNLFRGSSLVQLTRRMRLPIRFMAFLQKNNLCKNYERIKVCVCAVECVSLGGGGRYPGYTESTESEVYGTHGQLQDTTMKPKISMNALTSLFKNHS